jgi:aspartate carbamoyltransferase catalytic subunit
MGASVAVCAPKTLLPLDVSQMGVDVFTELDQAIEGADVINVLRLQRERQSQGLLPSPREYHRRYGVTLERLAGARKGLTIMHPGPINRGLEITPEVADGPYSVILDQVLNGVAVRMAVLFLLSGGEATIQ